MRELIKMVVVLTVICMSSGVVLSYVHEATERPREYQLLKYVKEPSIKAVLSEFGNDPIKDRVRVDLGEDQEIMVFPAKKNGKTFAVAYSSAAKGYHDQIELMVGVGANGKLTGISIMTHSEHPNQGSRYGS